MPTYQYACTTCDEQIEVIQRFTDAALTDCPTCDGRLRKVFSPVGVVFKGSGFYKTDSRRSRSSSGSSPGSSSGSGKPNAEPSTPAAESTAKAAPSTDTAAAS